MRALALLGGLSALGAALTGCAFDELQATGGGGGGDAGGGGVGGATTTTTSSMSSSAQTMCNNADGDPVEDCMGDCDDADPTVYPGAPEICGDGVDNACGTNPDPASLCPGGIGTYVSDAIGLDTNPGTQALPVLTIAAGMANAVTLGMTQPVFIAQGNYPENIDAVEGVDLWGGYSCVSASDCTWARDPKVYVSTIQATDADGLYMGHNITAATEIDGLEIIGLAGNPGNSGQTFSALYVQGSPVLRNNHVVGGAVTGCNYCNSDGITMSGAPAVLASALIEGNTIDGGASSGGSRGISLTAGASASIVRNEIRGGTAAWSRCVTIGGAPGPVTVANNALHAGSCLGNDTTFAIYLGQGVDSTIDSNQINMDPAKLGTCPGFSGTWWTGGIESEGSVATIINNAIKGVPSSRSTAVLLADCEGTCSVGSAVVVNNLLDGGGQANLAGSISAGVVFKTWKMGVTVISGRVGDNLIEAGLGTQSFGGYEDVVDQNGPVIGSTSRPQEFDYNSIFGATTMYRRWDGTMSVPLTTTAAVNAAGTGVNNATGNVSLDCPVDATGHLPAGSPCIDAGTAVGDTPPLDMDGEPRPQGSSVDIGADEAG